MNTALKNVTFSLVAVTLAVTVSASAQAATMVHAKLWDKGPDKGEVAELDPGKSGPLTVNLKPGHYLLICNVAGPA